MPRSARYTGVHICPTCRPPITVVYSWLNYLQEGNPPLLGAKIYAFWYQQNIVVPEPTFYALRSRLYGGIPENTPKESGSMVPRLHKVPSAPHVNVDWLEHGSVCPIDATLEGWLGHNGI